MNIKDSYIHNGTAVLKDVKVENSVLKKILAGKDANDAYLGWETVCDLTGIKPKAAGTADKVGHKLTFSGGVTGTWDGSADKTVAIPTKSSWNYDDVYLKLTGNGTTNPLTGTIYIKDVNGIILNSKDKDLNIWEVYGSSGAWTSQFGFNLQYVGTGYGNDNDLILWAHNQTGTHVESYRVKQDGTFIFKAAPKVGTNVMYHAGNLTIKTLMGTIAIGDADEPVYWNGSSFVKAGAYPTKASWNYDDVYLKLTGGKITGPVTFEMSNDRKIYINNSDDETYWSLISFQQKGTEYGTLGTAGSTDLQWNGHNLYHAGNLTASVIGSLGTLSNNISGNAATATNADKLDGVHYQNILERRNSGYSTSGTATGWFRIAETLAHDSGGITFLLAIQRDYGYTNNESYLFSISISYYGGISITQLSGYANSRLITKIRVDWSPSQIAYVDLYINASYTDNDYYWYTVGCAKSYTAWIANPTLVGTAYEFTTVQGCKSDRGFTGDLTGNATSATKLQNSRTIWGQSFDGTKNISGALTEVTDITASGNVSCSNLILPLGGKIHNGGNYGLYISGSAGDYGSAIYLTHDHGKNQTAFRIHSHYDSNLGGLTIGFSTTTQNYGTSPIEATYDDILHIRGNGNIGIGTTSPSYKLHVVGDIYTTTGFKKEGSSDSYVLLGGGGHKLLSDFSMAHSHPYLPLSGGTLTGSVTMRGMDTNLVRDIVYDGTTGWARNLITLRVDGVDKFGISAFGDYEAGASNNGIYYGYIGCNDYDGLNLRISATTLSWGDNPLLHSANFNSYAPTLTGTGATGTWGISITGNAATSGRTKFLETFQRNSTTTTYDAQYTIWAQWSDATNVRLKCTNYTVWTDKATYASNADLLDGYHAGVTNGSVSIFTPWPSGTTMKNEGLMPSEYGTEGYGHPDDVYLQSICKWAIAHYTNLGDITLIGAIAPNSSGTCILHLYSSSGKDSSTLLPRYCSGTYTTLSGYIYNFGTVNYTWYYRQVSAGYASSAGSATTSTYASNVGSSGTAGTNYVTASKVISACNWYDTMIGSDSDTVINRWSEIVSFVAGFKETPDLATFLSNNYLAKAGGTMTGQLKWKDNNALPQQTSPQYFLCIDAFDNGGTTKWASKSDTLKELTGLTSTAIGDSDEPVYWNGAKFVKAGAYPTKSSWNYDDRYLKLSGGTLTGVLHLLGSKYEDSANTGALDLANSDIYGVNSIKFADLAESAGEGLQWYRDATHVDSIWVKNGVIYFSPNRTWGGSDANYTVWHSGNDGTGSGLNADLLDGVHANGLFTNFSNKTVSGNKVLAATIGGKELTVAVEYAGSATNANYFLGCTNIITVAGDANTYYPVMVSTTTNKKFSNIITVWKDLGSKTASYPGNHSNGSSSMLYRYDIRNCYWDGNGGYCTTLDARYIYARLVSETMMLSNGVGNFCIWLRGGGTEYNISTSWNISSSDITVYYSSTNVGSSTYPVTIAPRTDIGNGGVYNNISIPCDVKYAYYAGSVAWDNVSNKPTFTTWPETSSIASYSLSNATWTNTITLPTTAGSYILNIVSGNSTLTGVFSIGASDNAKDEISLHLHGNGPRLYARTNGTTLQLSSNDASATSRSVTIKYRRMI